MAKKQKTMPESKKPAKVKAKKVVRKPTKTNTLKKAMIDALIKSLGIVSTACKTVGINRSTHYDWFNNDEHYAEQVNDVAEQAHDFVESQLHDQIRDGNTTATIFYMKCKMRSRGYVERQDVNLQTNRPDLSALTTDEIREHLKDGKK